MSHSEAEDWKCSKRFRVIAFCKFLVFMISFQKRVHWTLKNFAARRSSTFYKPCDFH